MNDQLGPLPAAAIELDEWGNGPYFDAGQMRAYAVREVAAERERCAQACLRAVWAREGAASFREIAEWMADEIRKA